MLIAERVGLGALCEVDSKLGYALMQQAAKIPLECLDFTRVQLAAVRRLELAS